MTFVAELDVAGRHIAVVGGSTDALGKISALLADGATVSVIAPEVATSIRDLAERDLLTWVPRPWTTEDLTDVALVVAATGDVQADAEVRQAAAAQHRLSISIRPAPVPEPADPSPERADPSPEPVEGQPASGGPSTSSGIGGAGSGNGVESGKGAGSGSAGSGNGTGRVILVGGGPGDPGLLTVAGLAAIRTADVIICDRLAPLAALEQARPGVEIIDVGKIPRGAFTSQDRINELLVEHARRGARVVRLKGGDNFIFGRGGEEWQACAAAQIPVEVIPGVSSAVAAPALAGIPLTHRQLTQGFTVVSGHLPPGHPGSTLDWAALARTNTTLVVLMGLATLSAITDELLRQDLAPHTPAATVADGGLASQQTIRGTVSDIAELTSRAGLKPPAITVIGAVAGFDPYDADPPPPR